MYPLLGLGASIREALPFSLKYLEIKSGHFIDVSPILFSGNKIMTH